MTTDRLARRMCNLDAADALRVNGLDVHARVVFNHVDRPGDDQRFTVVNAYGERYPWSLCPRARWRASAKPWRIGSSPT